MMAAALTHHFDPEKKEAAKMIIETIDLYGDGIYNLNYEAQTIVTKNIINDFRKRHHLVKAVEKTSLKDIIDNLDKNNNEFDDQYMKRVEENAFNDQIKAGEVLKETTNLYRLLVYHIESNAFLNPSESLDKVIAEINSVAERYGDIIQKRKGRNQNDEEQELPDFFS